MKEIYLDNSATTALSEGVKERMREVMEIYGNPSSLHFAGNAALDVLETARRQVAASLGVSRLEPGELIFTSCGSESDNLAILGTAFAKPRRRGMRVPIPSIPARRMRSVCWRHRALRSCGFRRAAASWILTAMRLR